MLCPFSMSGKRGFLPYTPDAFKAIHNINAVNISAQDAHSQNTSHDYYLRARSDRAQDIDVQGWTRNHEYQYVYSGSSSELWLVLATKHTCLSPDDVGFFVV